MKFKLLTLLALSCLLFITSGCIAVHKNGLTTHDVIDRSAITNGTKVVIFIAHEEHWQDDHRLHGNALLSDPQLNTVAGSYTNQTALGGSTTTTVGSASSTVSTNGISAVSAGVNGSISAIGTAVSNAKK